jgi:FixJ family two-component response regulator
MARPALDCLFSARFNPKLQKKPMKTPQTKSIARSLLEIRARLATLTRREREVLEYVVAGKSNKQIAGDLGTVEQTIKVHRAHVMQKMGARSVAELVRLMKRCQINGSIQ